MGSRNPNAPQRSVADEQIVTAAQNAIAPAAAAPFEVVICLKLLDDENGRQLWQENCLIQHRGPIKTLVEEAKEKFIPEHYKKKGNLMLRNVTIFSAKFSLEVSVAIDSPANSTKYTANFFLCSEEPTAQAESSSNTASLTRTGTAKQMFSSGQSAKQEFDKISMELKQRKTEFEKQMKLLMKAEKDLKELTKQKHTAQDIVKQLQKDLDGAKQEIAGLKEERRKLDADLKLLREKNAKKERDHELITKELEKLEKKKKGSERQLEVYKKELNEEMDSLNKLITKKETVLKEHEQLQEEKEKRVHSIQALQSEEKQCRERIEQLQQEEQSFHLMLEELREQFNVHQDQKQQCLTIAGGNDNQAPSSDLLNVRKAFTIPCTYFNNGGCWRGEQCTFIHDKFFQAQLLQFHGTRKRKFSNASRNDDVQDEEEGEIVEPQEISTSSTNIFEQTSFGEQQPFENSFDMGNAAHFQSSTTATFNSAVAANSLQDMAELWRLQQKALAASRVNNNEFAGMYNIPEYYFSQKHHRDTAPPPRFFASQNYYGTQKYYSTNNNRSKNGNELAATIQSDPVAAIDADNADQLFVDSSKSGGRRRSISKSRAPKRFRRITPNRTRKQPNELGSKKAAVAGVSLSSSATSTLTYGDRPRSNESLAGAGRSSIVDRITLEEPNGGGGAAKPSSRLHSRVTYQKK